MSDYREHYSHRQNLWGPMAPLIEPWITAMRAWTEAFSAFVPGGLAQQAWNPAGAAAPGSEGPLVSVQVSSPLPTEVTAKLRPGADLLALEAGPLQGSGYPPPVIDHVAITQEPGRVRVSVHVGADQPAGCYYGMIRSRADGSFVGDLTVLISEPFKEQV